MGSAAKHRRKRARTSENPGGPEKLKPKMPEKQIQSLPTAKAQLHIQECSFVHLDVSGVTALATSSCNSMFAVARADGTIELRRKEVLWAVSSVLHDHDADPEFSTSSMCFSNCSRYLFAGKLDGSLLVLKVSDEGLAEHLRFNPGGGAIWDLAISKHGSQKQVLIAVACDDGCVRFIEPDLTFTTFIIVDGLELPVLPTESTHYVVRISETTKARALSVAWSPPLTPNGVQCVVCGDSVGGVRWINPENGSLYGRGKIPSVRREEAMIWNVLFVSQGKYVVCGDSRGMATVWSSATNTMNQEVRVEGLEGAIWSSTVVSQGDGAETVFFGSAAGGVGGLQSLASLGESDRWLPLRSCNFHSHDVRAMVSFPNGTILSGSMDARLCLFDLSTFVDRKKIEWILPYHGCAGQSPVQFNRKGSMILSRREKGIDVWGISSDGSRSPSLRLRISFKSLRSKLMCCSLSQDCRQIAACSAETFRLLNVWDGEGSMNDTGSFGKVRNVPTSRSIEDILRGSVDVGFCGQSVVTITRCREQVAILEEGKLRMLHKDKIGAKGRFLEHIACSEEGIAVSDSQGHVFYAGISQAKEGDSEKWSMVHFGKGTTPQRVSAICISPSGRKVAIGRNDFSVWVATVANGKVERGQLVERFGDAVVSLSFSVSESSLLVSGEKFCAVASKLSAGKQTKNSQAFMLPFRDSVLGAFVTDESKAVVVRRRWELIQASLSDAIVRKPFGT